MGGPTVGAGEGGSLGVYSHAASPLRKAASANYLRQQAEESKRDDNRYPSIRGGSPLKRQMDPEKRTGMPGGADSRAVGTTAGLNSRLKDLRGDGVSRRQSGRF